MIPLDPETRRSHIAKRCAAFDRLPSDETSPGLKRAAVVIVLVEDDSGEISLLLTRRAARLRAHSRQWAFPGGRCDPGETAVMAGLRELREELNLELGPDEILCLLDDYPTRSGYLITPMVAWAPSRAVITPSPDEVASVHRISLNSILHPEAFDFISIPESPRRVVRFQYEDDRIHAPTAALIYQFREVLAGRMTRVADLEQPVFAWK